MILSGVKKIHFIGIGGTGLSAAAAYVRELGITVTGSDITESVFTTTLRQKGAQINIGSHRAGNIAGNIDLVVYSNAIKKSNPEIKKALRLNKSILKYSEFIGQLAENFIQIVVTGTHGKSTISAMLASIFIAGGLDPSVILGTNVPELDGNARVGLSRNFIIEGDEYKDAFLHYKPVGLIVNNIEYDHPDFFKNEQAVVASFKKIIKKVPHGGTIIANADDTNVMNAIKSAECKIITFGMGHGDYTITGIVQLGELTRCSVGGLEQFDLSLRIPGAHNAYNALAAALMAQNFGISIDVIKRALLEFSGSQRRFEIKGEKQGITVIDDYAHHPTAVQAVLRTARNMYPKRKIWCVFQPHSLSRVHTFKNEFASSFQQCDELIIADTYRVSGRESAGDTDTSPLVSEIKKKHAHVLHVPKFDDIVHHLVKECKPQDIVITMGAGTITEISDTLLKQL